MKFVADEGVDEQIIESIREAGHEVVSIRERSPGIGDSEVLAVAHSNEAVLITSDKDFGELAFRRERSHFGILLLRLHGLSPADKIRTVLSVLDGHATELTSSFAVASPGVVRIRRRQD